MTLVESVGAVLVIMGCAVGALEGHRRWRVRDWRDQQRAARIDSVDATVVGSLTAVIEALRTELARTQAEVARLSAGMTQMTAQIISQSNSMLVLKQDAERVVNLLVKVKTTQDEMLRAGTLKDKLADINTDALKLDTSG